MINLNILTYFRLKLHISEVQAQKHDYQAVLVSNSSFVRISADLTELLRLLTTFNLNFITLICVEIDFKPVRRSDLMNLWFAEMKADV